ncbi:MAG: LEA type 2 family protein [Flavobacteriaceae bacterium]|nr:LEA type 2 family protein [Flavobacteriaceae bacterium]
MMKKFTILLLILLTTSCAVKKKPEFIKIDGIELLEANSRTLTLKAEALFNNPNVVGGRLNTEGVNVFVNDMLMGIVSAEEFKVPAKNSFKVPLQIKINTKDLLSKDPNGFLSGLLNSVLNKNLKVTYKGVIQFKALGFSYKYPIDKTETVKIKL